MSTDFSNSDDFSADYPELPPEELPVALPTYQENTFVFHDSVYDTSQLEEQHLDDVGVSLGGVVGTFGTTSSDEDAMVDDGEEAGFSQSPESADIDMSDTGPWDDSVESVEEDLTSPDRSPESEEIAFTNPLENAEPVQEKPPPPPPPPPPPSTPKLPIPSEYKGQVAKDVQNARQITSDAKTVLEKILEDLSYDLDPATAHPQETAMFTKWFGPGSLTYEGVSEVMDRMSQAADVLADPNFITNRMGYDPDGSFRATTPGGAREPGKESAPWWFVRLDQGIFDRPQGEGLWTQEGIILHEVTHGIWASMDDLKSANTFSEADRLRDAETGAQMFPDKARAEASNYAFFAESSRNMIHPPPPPPRWAPSMGGGYYNPFIYPNNNR